MNNLEDALRQFLDANPDLPAGPPEPVNTPAREPSQRLAVRLERKGRAGKVATIISGFTLPPDRVADIASQLKSRLGAGGSARGSEILIQGDRRADLPRLLRDLGFPLHGH